MKKSVKSAYIFFVCLSFIFNIFAGEIEKKKRKSEHSQLIKLGLLASLNSIFTIPYLKKAGRDYETHQEKGLLFLDYCAIPGAIYSCLELSRITNKKINQAEVWHHIALAKALGHAGAAVSSLAFLVNLAVKYVRNYEKIKPDYNDLNALIVALSSAFSAYKSVPYAYKNFKIALFGK